VRWRTHAGRLLNAAAKASDFAFIVIRILSSDYGRF
jgi:hypothetical protein